MRPRMFPLLSVHGSVCVADDVLDDQATVSFWNFLKAKAESFLIRMLLLACKKLLDAAHFPACRLHLAVAQHNAEFISADSGKHILLADIAADSIRKVPDIPVALSMSIIIIHIFQMIQVTVAKDHTLATFQNLSGFLEEEQTVADSGSEDPCKPQSPACSGAASLLSPRG